MKDSNCIFCKLANGEIPTNSIYEDEDFKVILDAEPATKGHALILPKEHFKDIHEVDVSVASKIFPLCKKIAAKMKAALECDGINIVQNNGVEAGQTVFHLHVHLIPRYEGHDKIITWTHESFTAEEIDKIKSELSL